MWRLLAKTWQAGRRDGRRRRVGREGKTKLRPPWRLQCVDLCGGLPVVDVARRRQKKAGRRISSWPLVVVGVAVFAVVLERGVFLACHRVVPVEVRFFMDRCAPQSCDVVDKEAPLSVSPLQ